MLDCGSCFVRAIAAARLAAAALLLLAIGTSMTTAQTSDALTQKAREAARLMATAQATGHVRVIVTFEPPVPPGEVKADPATIARIKAGVASMQDAIIAQHFGSATRPAAGKGFDRGLRRFDITPGFVVNVGPAELQALAADARVRGIELDQAVPPLRLERVPPAGKGAS
jgi:hypothetical protein